MNIESMISPTSIAVLGASNRKGSVGNAVIANIVNGGFAGKVYPVNPSSETILGLTCYRSILEIGESVDIAVIITPNNVVPQVLEECGKKGGVKAAVIISAGFKEIGEQGKILEDKIKRIAKDYGIRLIGPNCIGFINTDPKVSLNASFTKGMPKSGNIALLSQSGAICVAMLEYAKMRNMGFSKVFSLGNKADLNENDLLAMLANDNATSVVLMYIEDLVNGRRFIEIASHITGESEKKRPILALKVGESAIGAKSIASHTGALAGSQEAYKAIFAQSGVLRVETLEELFDYAIAFAYQPIPKYGGGTVVVSNAGGAATIIADASSKYNLKLAKLTEKTVSELSKILPATASLINPIDIIGDADHIRYERTLRTILKDPNVDSCIIVSTPQMMLDMELLTDVTIKINNEFQEKTILSCMMAVAGIENALARLDENKIPQYSFPESATRAIATMLEYRSWVARPRTDVKTFEVVKDGVRKVFDKVRSQARNYLHETEAMEVLKSYGFQIPKSQLAQSEDECVKLSEEIGYPVVLKVSSPDIVHKTDVGGVELNLKNANEVRDAFRRIMDNAKKFKKDTKILGVNIQEFVANGKEMIIGMKRDPQFGPLLMFGLGGIYVEIIKDVSFRLAPLKELGALHMIESTKAGKLLLGVRGEKPSDIRSIVECLERMSQLVIDFPEIQEIDINPLLVFEQGKGSKAVDARMVIS
ncbi:MAG: acetate--CoA ligase family protein [Candidatus Nitrosopolaris sp.]